mgnify:FL=1
MRSLLKNFQGKLTFIAIGMSTFAEIDKAIQIFRDANCPFELMHCVSSYPTKNEDANLKMIQVLRDKYRCDVGYSGHEMGRVVSFIACVLGATSLERHITLNHAMYGSDQKVSIPVYDLCKLVHDIRSIDVIVGEGKKEISESEQSTRNKLRYYDKA